MVHVTKHQKLPRFDFILLAAALVLLIIGLLFIYSSGLSPDGSVDTGRFFRQLFWAISGLMIAVGVYFIHPDILRICTIPAYIICILFLVMTLLWGREVHGARSWIGIGEIGVQPSEFAKIITILFLADLAVRSERNTRPWQFALLLLIAGTLPTILVLMQPDLGTAIVFPPVILAILFISHLRLRYTIFLTLSLIISITLIFIVAWDNYADNKITAITHILQDGRILFIIITSLAIFLILGLFGYLTLRHPVFYALSFLSLLLKSSLILSLISLRLFKPFQMMRLIAFIDPYIDPRGAGWHIIQSKTTVGSGGLYGKGYLSGTQSQYHFLPEKSTDFIFSLLAEEWGFIGSFITLLLFLVIILRIGMLVYQTQHKFIQYVGVGIAIMFSFHVFINIGMTAGIMPITGIPLFFLSYGGSAIWTAMIGIAILLRMRTYLT